jgi:hypothetical protein
MPNKNLKAFLNKNKSKAGAKTDLKKEDAVDQEAQKANDASVEAKQEVEKKVAGDSSDEEVEDDIDLDVEYGNIKENKDVAEKKQEENSTGFGFEESMITGKPKVEQQDDKKAKKPTGPISFGGGRPMFSRKPKGVLEGKFEAGLDDLDDDMNPKAKAVDAKKATGAAGGREFINLGASA